MKYQVLSITLDSGNAVFLPHAFELAADSLGEVGAKIEENFAELGLKVKGVRALHKSDVTEDWQREPEKPNLFNEQGEELPRRRKPKVYREDGNGFIEEDFVPAAHNGEDVEEKPKRRKPKKTLAIADMREKPA